MNSIIFAVVLSGIVVGRLSGATTLVRPSSSQIDVDKSDGDDETEAYDGLQVPFHLEEIYRGEFNAKYFNGTWISPTEILYLDTKITNILKFDVRTLKSSLYFDFDTLEDLNWTTYSLSSDSSLILIGYDPVSGFRHSVRRRYVVFDPANRSREDLADGKHIQLVSWSPVGSDLIYVLDNDIYYRHKDINGTVKIRQLTTDGQVDVVYNGVPDWVYEEEVFGTESALWFSADGKHLAFASMNDSSVKDVNYIHYGMPGDIDDQYPKVVKIKFPKAGSSNPTVKLGLINLSDEKSSIINLKAPVEVGTEPVLFGVSWMTNKTLVATWMNRVQNTAELVVYHTNSKSKIVLKLEEKSGWLNSPTVVYDRKNRRLVMLKSQPVDRDSGKFMHLTTYAVTSDGTLSNETDLSPGAYNVQHILKIDDVADRIYYLASAPGEPSSQNLYSVQTNGSQPPNCISCNLVTPEGNVCKYSTAYFSKDKSYYALVCYGPDPPVVQIVNAINQHEIYFWEGNERLRKKLAHRLQPLQRDFYVTANNYSSKVRLLLPHDFDENKKYPMIVKVYAGPGSMMITDSSSFNYNTYLTSNRSVISALIDGRGTANRGSASLYQVYKSLGTVEIQDQLAVTKILQDTYPWIDRNNTGIWGWSYGGYATALALANDKHNIFSCGISVAPVTSWIYYDSIYTERYMGLPTLSDNWKGYLRSDVTRYVEGFRGKKYMLVHGTGDDNVHYQHAMSLAKALVNADILFDQVSYTDEAHSLNLVSPHLYLTMDNFWTRCFNL